MTQAIVPKELLTATPGGLSLLVVTGGSDGDVLTRQSDGTYAPETPSAGGTGDVVGPSSATDNAIARFDATTGKLIQNSGVTIDDSNNLTLASTSTIYLGSPMSGRALLANSSRKQLSVNQYGEFGVSISVDGLWSMTGWNVARPRFCLGGITSAFPAIKAVAATIAMRLADDSADADITAAAITASGLMCCGVYTFATVPSASSNTGKFLRISDRAQKHAYSDGTDWRFFGDDAIIS